MESSVQRKIVHIKARPTYSNVNNLIMLLKKLDLKGQKVPKLEALNSEGIAHFCEEVQRVFSQVGFEPKSKKITTISDFYRFEEAKLLPMFSKEASSREDVETNETDSETEIDSDDSEAEAEADAADANADSEAESEAEREAGYEFYEEDDEAEFSD